MKNDMLIGVLVSGVLSIMLVSSGCDSAATPAVVNFDSGETPVATPLFATSAGCTVSQTATGATVSCTDGTTAVITNGVAGTTGSLGLKGATGYSGASGSNGSNGSVGPTGAAGSPGTSAPVYILEKADGTFVSDNVIGYVPFIVGTLVPAVVTVMDTANNAVASYDSSHGNLTGNTGGLVYFDGLSCTGNAYLQYVPGSGPTPINTLFAVGPALFVTRYSSTSSVIVKSSWTTIGGGLFGCTVVGGTQISLQAVVAYTGALPANIGLQWGVRAQ